jgi:mannose-6-phosphate isomerase-like protein (cupin superfamily)
MTSIHRFADLAWHVPTSDPDELDLDTPAPDDAPGRKFLAQGTGGFFTQVVRIPPGFDAPRHAHDHAEVFMVLEGSCLFNGEPMGRFDMTVVEAHEPYAFVAGPNGVQFLVVRQDRARFIAAG